MIAAALVLDLVTRFVVVAFLLAFVVVLGMALFVSFEGRRR